MSTGSTPQLPPSVSIDGHEASAPARAHVVVGWVDTPEGHAALRYAAAIAHRLEAQVHVVHVPDVDDLPVDPDADDFEEQLEAHLQHSVPVIAQTLEGLPAGWDLRSPRGSAVPLLHQLAEATDALMIVIGSPHKGVLAALENLFGQSVARSLLDRRRRALVVVPDDVVIPD